MFHCAGYWFGNVLLGKMAQADSWVFSEIMSTSEFFNVSSDITKVLVILYSRQWFRVEQLVLTVIVHHVHVHHCWTKLVARVKGKVPPPKYGSLLWKSASLEADFSKNKWSYPLQGHILNFLNKLSAPLQHFFVTWIPALLWNGPVFGLWTRPLKTIYLLCSCLGSTKLPSIRAI